MDPNGILCRTACAIAVVACLSPESVQADPLAVVATTPELGSIVRVLAGESCRETERYYTWECDDLKLTVLAKPAEDPHYVDPRPSFINRLNEADMLVQNGLGLEVGWLPRLVNTSRNNRIMPAQTTGNVSGFVDASVVITPMLVSTVSATGRLMGDLHPGGNPHFLADPLNGIKVARLIGDTAIRLRPQRQEAVQGRFAQWEREIHERLVGRSLASKYPAEKLAALAEHGKLLPFLESQGEAARLGGWLGAMRLFHGFRVVGDHILWPYFAHRFGIEVALHLEPKPGVPPTTSHMKDVIEEMKTQGIGVLLQAAYYQARYADFVAEQTGATIARMANQTGARPGTEGYVDMVDYNVRELVRALTASRGSGD